VIVASAPVLEKTINLSADKSTLVRLLAFGLMLVAVLLLRPEGLLPEGVTPGALARRLRARRRRGGVASIRAEAPPAEMARPIDHEATQEPKPVVEVRDLRKSFDGIRAVDGLSFELLEGRVTGLLGPNGAGKTTVFNLLTGALPPDEGTVLLRGQDITRWPIDRVARHGMVRSFQDVRVFTNLAVLDNVRMAVPAQRGESLRDLFLTPWRVIADQRRALRLARQQLEFLGLADKEHVKVGTLPFGEQKLVALARILATDAEVLLLDEPASGIDVGWVERTIEIIGRLRDRGFTICVVEHNMHVLEQLSDRLYFMEAGRISAQGTMSDLAADERLAEVYFGQA
jgi:branched-chain amino acid transport system permease protein